MKQAAFLTVLILLFGAVLYGLMSHDTGQKDPRFWTSQMVFCFLATWTAISSLLVVGSTLDTHE